MSCLPHDSSGEGGQPAAVVKPNSAAANSQSLVPSRSSRSACVTHQCKVSSQRNLKNAAVRDFVHHHDGDADDEAVAVACCNATSTSSSCFRALSESESGPPPRCQCLLCLLPWPQNACRWAKLPNLFHLRWKYNCGYVHVDDDDDGDGDGDGGGSVRAFYCPFCSSCFCCCLFSFCWNFIIENVSMDVGSAKSAYLTPFADAVVFNLKGVLLLVTSASAFPIPPGNEWVKGFAVVS